MNMTTDPIPKWQRVTGWVLSGILTVVFLPSLDAHGGKTD
jgi:hypothetical protein